jgi:hypothetical protein
MAIIVKNTNNDRNKAGLLSKAVIIKDTVQTIYRFRDDGLHCNANVQIVNTNVAPAEIIIWVSSNKTPTIVDLLESKITLDSNAVFIRTNIIMSAGETIFVQSNQDNCVVRIDGYEDNPL